MLLVLLVLLVLWEPELSGHTVKGLADALQLDASTSNACRAPASSAVNVTRAYLAGQRLPLSRLITDPSVSYNISS